MEKGKGGVFILRIPMAQVTDIRWVIRVHAGVIALEHKVRFAPPELFLQKTVRLQAVTVLIASVFS